MRSPSAAFALLLLSCSGASEEPAAADVGVDARDEADASVPAADAAADAAPLDADLDARADAPSDSGAPGCGDGLVAWSIAGKTIHVAPSGDDVTGDGSKSKPFATLAKAATLASPGDGIVLAGGKYTLSRSTYLTLKGTKSAPIVVTGAPGTTPVLDAAGAKLDSFSAGVVLRNSSYVVVDGLEIANTSEAGLAIVESDHVTVQRCHLHHVRYQGIRVNGNDIAIVGNEIDHAVLSNEGAVLEPKGGGWAAAMSSWRRADLSRSERIYFVGNHIHDSWGECLIAFFLDGGAIRGNRIHDCFSVSAYLDHARDVAVERNFIYVTKDTYNRSPDKSRRAHGIAFAVEHYSGPAFANDDILVANNLVVGTQTGLFFWNDTRNTSPQNTYRSVRALHNVFWDLRGAAVSFASVAATADKPSNCRFARNVVASKAGTSAVSIGNGDAWTFEQNDFVHGVPAVAKEPGTFSADPQLVSPSLASGPEGFRPKPGSPILSLADRLAEVPIDHWCAPRSARTSLGIAVP